MRAWLATAVIATGMALAQPGLAADRLPYPEILDTVRALAADELGVKASDIDTLRSLAAQGMSVKQLHSLIIAMQQEFRVVIPENELAQAKWNDEVTPLSVQRLAQMVSRQMQSPSPSPW